MSGFGKKILSKAASSKGNIFGSNNNNNQTDLGIRIAPSISELPVEKVFEIAGRMAHGGIEVRDRKYRFQTYEKCWRGDDACNFLTSVYKNVIKSRMEAVMFGQRLMRDKLVVHTSGRPTFEDGEYFYRFTDDLISDERSLIAVQEEDPSEHRNSNNKGALGGLLTSLTGTVAAKDPSSLPYIVIKQGWLQKKNQDRFFVLEKTTNRLYWFKKEPDPLHDWSKICQSSIELAGLKVIQTPTTIFEISDPSGRNYLLNCPSQTEVKQWTEKISGLVNQTAKSSEDRLQHTAINQSNSVKLEKSGWLTKKGQRRYFTLKESIIAWYLTDKLDTVKGHLDLTRCTVDFLHNDLLSFVIYNPGGENYKLTANTQDECGEWVAILKLASSGKGTSGSATLDSNKDERVGWMTKKNKKRWFILQDETLRWYTTQAAVKEQNCLPLSDCTLNRIDNLTFLISTPDDSWYHLKAPTEHETSNWMGWIQEAIVNEQRVIDAGIQKRGWLEKKLKKRWYALKSGMLMWFSQRQAFDGISPQNANGFIRCEEYDIRLNENKISFTIEHKIDKNDKSRHWHIKASSPTEAQNWVQVITEAANPKKEKKLGKVFGVELAKQEKNNENIPVAVDHIVSFMIKCALDIQGIFRLSGAVSRLQSYRDEYDLGRFPKLNPRDDDDVHAVAGLLKAWLRELPEPLLTFDLYMPLLQAGDNVGKIGELLSGLPDDNYECLRYLFNFIVLINQHSEKNQMIASNLAIVFGPNLLRSRNPSPAELAHTPHIIQLITTLINNCETIFGTVSPPSWA